MSFVKELAINQALLTMIYLLEEKTRIISFV